MNNVCRSRRTPYIRNSKATYTIYCVCGLLFVARCGILLNRKEVTLLAKPIKPGTDNQRPGTYVEVGPRGGKVDNPRVVHIDAGDRLPPTQEPGRGWQKK